MKLTQALYDKLKKLNSAYLDNKGREVLNPVPTSFPTTLKKPPTLMQQLKRVLKHELDQQAQEQGYESIAEADDFDVPDSFDIEALSKYTVLNMEIPIQEMIKEVPENETTTDTKNSASMADDSTDNTDDPGLDTGVTTEPAQKG